MHPSVDATAAGPPTGGAERAGRRWVDGVGWVVDGAGDIPAGARWVPGVGYVDDDA